MKRNWQKRLLWLLVPLALIALDQWTKDLARVHIEEYGEHIDIIDGFFRLNRVQNEGAAFGLFADLEEGLRETVLTSLGGLALLLVVFYSLRLRPSDWLPQLGLHMILAGAVGNLLDRFTIGSVTDFLEFYWQEFRWPAFNFADSAIVMGVCILLIDTFLPRHGDQPAADQPEPIPDPQSEKQIEMEKADVS